MNDELGRVWKEIGRHIVLAYYTEICLKETEANHAKRQS
jgi:hypothetical protein